MNKTLNQGLQNRRNLPVLIRNVQPHPLLLEPLEQTLNRLCCLDHLLLLSSVHWGLGDDNFLGKLPLQRLHSQVVFYLGSLT